MQQTKGATTPPNKPGTHALQPAPQPGWTGMQRRMDNEWRDWIASPTTRGAIRLNLSGHPSAQLQSLGFVEGNCLHLTHCHDEEMGTKLITYLKGMGLDNGQVVIVALPTHIVLRDLLLAGISGITGRLPTVIYAHERQGTTQWNRRADLQDLRQVARNARNNILVM